MKVNFAWRHAVDIPFRIRDALKNGGRLLFHPGRQPAGLDQIADLRKCAAMLVVFVTVCMLNFTMGMAVRMRMLVRVSMVMVMVMMLASLWIVVMVALMAVTVQVHIKFHAFDAGFVFPFGVQVKLI